MAEAYPGFCSSCDYCYSPPERDASPSQGYPQQHVTDTHLYTWVERDKVG